MRGLLMISVMMLMGGTALAQFFATGTVRDKANSKPIPGVSVLVQGTKNGTVTDTDGNYRLKLDEGNYVLIFFFSYVGYKTVRDTVEVRSNVVVDIFLEEGVEELEEVIVIHATRANESTPTTYINVDNHEIRKQNFGQDLPYLLNWTPSVVTTSDAGTGIGYTGIRIRGSDPTRTNVTINGIPYNDSESQSTFWVDIPDISSSTQSAQIQRGVGTSTNGAGSFGGAINLDTRAGSAGHGHYEPYAEAIVSGGSFGSQRYTLKGGYNVFGSTFIEAKVTKIKSDGYVDRGSSDLTSYYFRLADDWLAGTAIGVQLIAFGGYERTYQAWYGVDSATLHTNRRMNYAGAIYDTLGNITSYYKDQVDDYRQDNGQFHLSFGAANWDFKLAFHGTYGRGYYEEYHQGRSFASVGLPDFGSATNSDMVLRKWLDNYFYGVTYSASYSVAKSAIVIGGAASWYEPAKHFGEIIWAKEAGSVTPGHRYYQGQSDKGDRNVYVKWNYRWTDRLSSFIDLQYRGVNYTTLGTQDDQSSYYVDDQFHFFNPKLGIRYLVGKENQLYASYSIANREPNRSDYLEGTTKPRSERLFNLEVGARRRTKVYDLDVNYYLMQYKDQLVQTGALDPGGYPVRANIGNSYRTGIELSGTWRISSSVTWNANGTFSVNQNKDYVVFNGPVPVVRDTKIILSPGLIAGSQLSWRPFKGFESAWLSKYVGEQFLDNTESSAVRLSDYWVNDLRLSYELSPKGIRSISWSLLLNNLFDTMYSSNGYSYGGVPYYYPQAGRNFMAMMTVRL